MQTQCSLNHPLDEDIDWEKKVETLANKIRHYNPDEIMEPQKRKLMK